MQTFKRALWFIRPALFPSVVEWCAFRLLPHSMLLGARIGLGALIVLIGFLVQAFCVDLIWPGLKKEFCDRWLESSYHYPAAVPVQDEDED